MAERERRDFLIVGAGPAGLAAALEAARADVDTCVVDLRQRHDVSQRRLPKIYAAGAEVRLNTSAWGIWGRTVAICPAGGHAQRVTAEHVLLAPAARPRPIVFPGWRLPGVTFSTAEISGRVVLAGSGPDLAARAVVLHRQGVNVRAVVEAASAPWDVQSAAYLRHRGVSLRNRHLLVRAEGADHVERGVVARVDADWRVQPATESTFEVDTIVLDYGEVPAMQLMRVAEMLRQLATLRSLDVQVAEGEFAERLGVVRCKHQAEVIDARWRRRNRWLRQRHLAMHMATEDERGRPGQLDDLPSRPPDGSDPPDRNAAPRADQSAARLAGSMIPPFLDA